MEINYVNNLIFNATPGPYCPVLILTGRSLQCFAMGTALPISTDIFYTWWVVSSSCVQQYITGL